MGGRGDHRGRGAVLVVDDSPVARRALGRALGKLAPEALVVERDSVAAATAGPYACAVLDLELPDGTGVDVAEALRREAPELPVAFFTAGAPDAVVARARAFGPVFAKPAELEGVAAWAADQLLR